jgi:tRNA/tmRNA/rRNA uracil-C5-methylase (TrmA/RlmC/RlmD family)
MRVGEELTIEPAELVAGGDALAKIDGFPLFVSNVYPGDTARVRIVELKKGFGRAELIRIEKPSALRRTLPCPVAADCGGCDWTDLRLDAQLAAKERILRESLRRIGKLDPANLPRIMVHPSPLNYRLRSRLHTEGGKTGFYATGSHRVVPLASECEVVGPLTAAAIGSGGGSTEDGEREIWELDGKLIDDVREIAITVEGRRFRLSTDAFFQVNRHLLGTMLRLVRVHAENTRDRRRAVDLYAGVGFFSAPLADAFEQVVAVEGSSVSHYWARLNAPANVEAIQAPVEQWVERMADAAFVFLDPPRSGVHRNVIDAIAAKATEVICFLACDPVTFARDAQRLTASGWRLAALDLLDLFPNTHHLETLARFERASSET